MRLTFVLCLVAAPVAADVSGIVSGHVLPRHATLAQETRQLAEAANANCSREALAPNFNTAYDAWIAVSHLQLGPIEDQGLSLAMSFWPDTKDRTGKALARLTSVQDPIVGAPEAFEEVSAAAQGFTALERVLYGDEPATDYTCQLTRAIASGLVRKSEHLLDDWPAFAILITTAGDAGNTRFQSAEEAQRAFYTALSTGLEFLHDQRLGRPLGTYDRPRPLRAEARRSERSLRNIAVSLAALEELAGLMSDDPLPKTRAAFADAGARARALDDPALAGVADPMSRIRIEVLQQAVHEIQMSVVEEIGTPLGISAGFNSLDGD